MSIVLGESQRDVYARPYFRGLTVCSRADVEIGYLVTSQAPDSLGCCHQQPPIWRPGRKPGKLRQTESRPHVSRMRT